MNCLRICPVVLCVLAASPGATHADFMYADFGSTAGLTLNGDAAAVDGRLRLTPAEFLKRGSAWYTAGQKVGGGFDTTFRFRVSEPAGRFNDPAGDPGGDGIAFVVQAIGPEALGGYGGSLGYGDDTGTPGIPRSLAVEFDTWFNPPSEWDDPNGNHISVHTRGLLPNSAHEMFSLASTTAIPDLSDGSIHTARVLYSPGSLSIYLDDLLAPRLVVPLDLGPTLDLDDGRAWVGFTSATWNAWENHDIQSWSFAAVPEPGSLVLFGLGTAVVFGVTCRRRIARGNAVSGCRSS